MVEDTRHAAKRFRIVFRVIFAVEDLVMSISQRPVVIKWYNVAKTESSRSRRDRPSKVIKDFVQENGTKKKQCQSPALCMRDKDAGRCRPMKEKQ